MVHKWEGQAGLREPVTGWWSIQELATEGRALITPGPPRAGGGSCGLSWAGERLPDRGCGESSHWDCAWQGGSKGHDSAGFVFLRSDSSDAGPSPEGKPREKLESRIACGSKSLVPQGTEQGRQQGENRSGGQRGIASTGDVVSD